MPPMTDYRTHQLCNGLTVITHHVTDTPLATVNILYNVGSRNEDPHLTGFAHLFEHLMFGGTKRFPDFDTIVNQLGGESNAFTNCDYTNYYITLPAESLLTALTLEADRMQGLDLTQQALEVQQQVVTEEYHQRYINQPYGDLWLHLRPLNYTTHPYRWPTIGADIRHVAEAKLEDVVRFHSLHYRPSNAILAIAAPQTHGEQLLLAEQAFQSQATGHTPPPLPLFRADEPPQTAPRCISIQRPVPQSAVYLTYPMCSHGHPHFHAFDLISDLLGNGTSSRLHQHLVRRDQLFTHVDACITGDEGPGLLLLGGKLSPGITPQQGADALHAEAAALAANGPEAHELQKVINRYESTYLFGHYKAADRAHALCYYTWLGNTALIDTEPQNYRRVTASDITTAARALFQPQHENRLYYEAVQR